MKKLIKKHISEHDSVLNSMSELIESIEKISQILISCLKNDGTIFWCGNGGSASDSEHLAAELVGRFVNERKSLKSIALSANSALITSIANDYGYEHIFSRQVDGLGSKDDVLIGISTSGNSQNILNAYQAANNKGMYTIGFIGKGGGKTPSIVKQSIIIPSNSTARIQEMHILIGHIICDLIEEGLNLKH